MKKLALALLFTIPTTTLAADQDLYKSFEYIRASLEEGVNPHNIENLFINTQTEINMAKRTNPPLAEEAQKCLQQYRVIKLQAEMNAYFVGQRDWREDERILQKDMKVASECVDKLY
jgi:hypothetical protein